MKKFVPIVIAVLVILAIGGARYRYTTNRYKDVHYSVQKYLTSGLINKYKLYNINNMKLSFSDGSIAVMNVSGMLNKSPHKTVEYKVFLEKSKNGIWRVKKVYTE
jgi:hypothetical protein